MGLTLLALPSKASGKNNFDTLSYFTCDKAIKAIKL
jgi:hypothetical protein